VPKSDGKVASFADAQRRRQAQAEAATERARQQEVAQALARLRRREDHRRPGSVPPPGT
jgi:hypothetical protein